MSVENGPYVIGFNGPPRSGKDTLANLLVGQLGRMYDIPMHRGILAAPMRARMEALFGDGSPEWYEQNKDKPLDIIDGKTPRWVMIEDSEESLKPKYGQDFWAKIYHHRNRNWWGILPGLVVFSDIGFESEVRYFVDHAKDYLNVRLTRTGTDFSNDSRRYVDTVEGAKQFPLSNDSHPMAAVETLAQHIASLNWKL